MTKKAKKAVKEIKSAESQQAVATGLPPELLKRLASYGVAPTTEYAQVQGIHSGSYLLDYLLGGYGFPRGRATTFAGEYKTGKAQPLSAKVLTHSGWKTMGEIQVGDKLVNPHGGLTGVVGIYPQGEKSVYRVTFLDGSSTECSAEHLWKVRRRSQKNWTVRDLQSMLDEGMHTKGGGLMKFAVETVSSLEFEPQCLPIPPYVLGTLLGDGSLTEGAPENPLQTALKELGLAGSNSFTKFIPVAYKLGSHEQRIDLLQGLMDTDGTNNNARTIGAEYSTVSIQLANDVRDLAWSLGGRATVTPRRTSCTHKGERKLVAVSYCVYISLPSPINPFKLAQKAEAYNCSVKHQPVRYIKSVERVGYEKCQCIMVDSDNHLYVTDDYTVTHNTTLVTNACGVVTRTGGKVAYFDTENKLSGAWAEKLGCDMANFHFYPVDNGEQLINSITAILEYDIYDMIVIDSVGGTTWANEKESEAGEEPMLIAAKRWWRFRRTLTAPLKHSKAALVLINNLYSGPVMFGDPNKEPGGKAIPGMASIRMKMLEPNRKDAPNQIVFRPKNVHNQIAEEGREGDIVLQFIDGVPFVNPLPEMTQLGKLLGVFTVKGSWYWFGEERLGGSEALTQEMLKDETLFDRVEAAIFAAMDKMNHPEKRTEAPDEFEEDVTDVIETIEAMKSEKDGLGVEDFLNRNASIELPDMEEA